MNKKKFKSLGDTQEFDAAAVRKGKTQRSNAAEKREISKGGSMFSKDKDLNAFKRTQNKKVVTAQKKNPPKKKSGEVKKSTAKTVSAASKNTKNAPKKTTPKTNGTQKKGTTKKRYVPLEKSTYQSGDIKRKKHSTKKKRYRRIKRIISLFLLAVTVLFAMTAVICGTAFKIKDIQIEYNASDKNAPRYKSSQVIDISGLKKGKNLILCNEEKAENAIKENLPYVYQAKITKKYPGTIVISVNETKEVYSYIFGSSFVVADSSNKALEIITDKASAGKNTVVKGARISSAKAGEYIDFTDYKTNEDKKKDDVNQYKNDVDSIIASVKASGIKKLTEIDITKMNDIYMVYDGRIRLHLGDRSNLTDKLKLASKTAQAEDKNSLTQTGEMNLTIHKKAYFTPD